MGNAIINTLHALIQSALRVRFDQDGVVTLSSVDVYITSTGLCLTPSSSSVLHGKLITVQNLYPYISGDTVTGDKILTVSSWDIHHLYNTLYGLLNLKLTEEQFIDFCKAFKST